MVQLVGFNGVARAPADREKVEDTMTDPMTDGQLEAIKARCKLASMPPTSAGYAEFCHYARADIPALLAEVERLREAHSTQGLELGETKRWYCCAIVERDRARARVEELEKSEMKLLALEGAGVDNWEGYDDAMEMMREEDPHV
jgi:hypothetical protein